MNDSLQDKIKKLHLAGILQTADMRAEQAVNLCSGDWGIYPEERKHSIYRTSGNREDTSIHSSWH